MLRPSIINLEIIFDSISGETTLYLGSNLIQIDLDDKSHEFLGERTLESDGPGGQPVGGWSACAISEAAYGALDQPISMTEKSPLLNLKVFVYHFYLI